VRPCGACEQSLAVNFSLPVTRDLYVISLESAGSVGRTTEPCHEPPQDTPVATITKPQYHSGVSLRLDVGTTPQTPKRRQDPRGKTQNKYAKCGWYGSSGLQLPVLLLPRRSQGPETEKMVGA